ncbi:MAG: hypothetical protein ACOZAL_00075, partial [Patescibacteria group bacterium]
EVKELIKLEKRFEDPNCLIPATTRSEIQSQKARIEAMKTVLGLSDEEVEKIKKELLSWYPF